jgi:hypothetical protein
MRAVQRAIDDGAGAELIAVLLDLVEKLEYNLIGEFSHNIEPEDLDLFNECNAIRRQLGFEEKEPREG